jgi:hypothetical protein
MKILISILALALSAMTFAANTDYKTKNIALSVSYPASAQISNEDRLAILIINAREELAFSLDHELKMNSVMTKSSMDTTLSLSTALTLKEEVYNVKHMMKGDDFITTATVSFTYKPIDIVTRAKELKKVNGLREELAKAVKQNKKYLSEISGLMADNSAISVERAVQMAKSKAGATVGYTNSVELPDLAARIKAKIAKNIAKNNKPKGTRGKEFVDAYLPALRDSMQLSYYDVIPHTERGKAYAFIRAEFNLPFLKDGKPSPVVNTLSLLPDAYRKMVKGNISVFEALNPGFKGFVGGSNVKRRRSIMVDSNSKCKNYVFNPSQYAIKGLEGDLQSGIMGSGGIKECFSHNGVMRDDRYMTNIVMAATLKGRLILSVRWPELDLYVEEVISDVGEFSFDTINVEELIQLPISDIPKLGKMEYRFWIAGQDKRPFVQKNTTARKRTDKGELSREVMNSIVKEFKSNKKNSNNGTIKEQYINSYSQANRGGRRYFKIKPRVNDLKGLGTYGVSEGDLDFKLSNYDGDHQFIEAAYRSKDAPVRLGKYPSENLTWVKLRYDEYEYDKDMVETTLYGKDNLKFFGNGSASPDKYMNEVEIEMIREIISK